MAIAHSPRVARAVISIGRELGATDEEIIGALAGGLVEANLRNLNGGHLDSRGVYQQRESIYGRLSLDEQIRAFYSGTKAVGGEWKKGLLQTRDMGGTIGQRVQAVQASAYPDRYDERIGDAERIYGMYVDARGGDPAELDDDDEADDGMGAGDVDDDFDVDAALIPLFSTVSDAIRRGALDQDASGLAGLLGMGGDEDDEDAMALPTSFDASAQAGAVTGDVDAPSILTMPDGTKVNASFLDDEGAEAMHESGDTATGARARHGTAQPMAWGGYDNGKIPTSALMRINNMHYSGRAAHYFAPDAGEAMKAMRRDARRQGVKITLTDSYRSFAAQQDVYDRKKGQVAVATPGTSIHGWGKAVDVAGDEARRWIQQNGEKYGWVWPTWARSGSSYEPWHFEYRPEG